MVYYVLLPPACTGSGGDGETTSNLGTRIGVCHPGRYMREPMPFPDPCWSTPNLARNSPGFYLLVMGPADGNDQAVDRDRSSRPDVVGYNYPEQPTRPSCWSMFRPGFSQILVLLPTPFHTLSSLLSQPTRRTLRTHLT